MQDRFDLERFVAAQDPVLPSVRRELEEGRKRSHWMWFVFPQLAGLGSSPMARRYALASIEEAKAFLAHDVLGRRLIELTGVVNAIERRPVGEIFGHPDDLKFHSSMTLFVRAGAGSLVFGRALDRYFGGREDAATVRLLGPG